MSTLSPAPDIRWITPDELPEWSRAVDTGFLRPTTHSTSEQVVAFRRGFVDPRRTLGAFDGPRCVATFRSSPQELTVPGGGTLTASGVTNVTVTATHRRRGLLRRMMATELAACVERGEPLAILDSAEYGIYGRYGFGPASTTVTFEIDVTRAAPGPFEPSADGGVEVVDAAEFLKHVPEAHDRFRVTRHGVIPRDDHFWREATTDLGLPDRPFRPSTHVLYRDASGRVDGWLSYVVDDKWDNNQPRCVLRVRDLIGVTPRAEAALWRYAMSVDWVATVEAPGRAPDDILPLLLGDPRSARRTLHTDFLWLRPLDVPRLLAARTYGAPGSVVFEVADPAGFAAGRFLLEGGPDGAACAATAREADVTLDAAALGSLYLGDETATRLASVGRVAEERAGALTRVDAMFRTGRRPWCPDMF
ncbi:GNAT family N-acetyltransferase [Streptomyces capparidis]